MGMQEILVEKSPSNKTKCYNCHKDIEKDTLRIVIKEQGFQFPKKSYGCQACGIERLKAEQRIMQKKIDILEGKNE